ncbi:MAG: glycosyltransferase family 2 protein [Clostridium sp.]
MKLSVIVPVYNGEKYINRCIESILKNKSKEYEIIVVDDGSKDNSLRILKNFKDIRIKVFHQSNKGVSVARNYGISLANGKFILFVDCDDWLEDGAIDLIISNLSGELDLYIYSNYWANSDKKYSMKATRIFKEYFDFSSKKEKLYSKLLSTDELNVPWGKVYKKEIIDNNKVVFPNGVSIGEDLKFNLEYFRYVKIWKYLYIPIYYYNETENSATKKFNIKRFEQFIVTYKERIKYLYIYFDKDLIIKEEKEKIYNHYFLTFYQLISDAYNFGCPKQLIINIINNKYIKEIINNSTIGEIRKHIINNYLFIIFKIDKVKRNMKLCIKGVIGCVRRRRI